MGDVVLCNSHLAIRSNHLGFHLIANQAENKPAFSTILLGRGLRTPPEPGREGVGLGEYWSGYIVLG